MNIQGQISMPYTLDDLKILLELDPIIYAPIHIIEDLDDPLNDIFDCLHMFISRGSIPVEGEREVDFYVFLQIYHKDVFDFLMMSFDKTPLYIRDEKLKVFAEWRLKINK